MMNQSNIQQDLLSEDIIIAFWLSFTMLLFISILKYFVNNKSNYKDWGEMILELPIDVCTIFITMLISLAYNNNPKNTFIAIFGVLIAVVLCCYFRKKSQLNSICENYWLMILYAIGDIGVCLLCCYLIVEYW